MRRTCMRASAPSYGTQEFEQIRHIVRHGRHFTTLVRRIYMVFRSMVCSKCEEKHMRNALSERIQNLLCAKVVTPRTADIYINSTPKMPLWCSGACVLFFLPFFFSFSLFISLQCHEVTNYWLNLLPLNLIWNNPKFIKNHHHQDDKNEKQQAKRRIREKIIHKYSTMLVYVDIKYWKIQCAFVFRTKANISKNYGRTLLCAPDIRPLTECKSQNRERNDRPTDFIWLQRLSRWFIITLVPLFPQFQYHATATTIFIHI